MTGAESLFVPDVGFRPRDGLAMAAPVTVTKDGDRALRVMHLISTEAGTEITLEVRDTELAARCVGPPVDYGWHTRIEAVLRDVEGVASRRSSGPGESHSMGQHAFGFFREGLIFERLPPGTRNALLELRGELGDWDVPLELVPLAESGVVPVVPIGAEQVRGGVTVRVVGMAVTDDAIMLDVEATSPDASYVEIGAWLPRGAPDNLALVDDAGHRVEVPGLRDRLRLSGRGSAVFPRVDSRTLTLVVPSVVLQERGTSLDLSLPIFAPTDLAFGRHPVRIRYADVVDDLRLAPGEEPRHGVEVQIATGGPEATRVLRPGSVLVDGVERAHSGGRGADSSLVRVHIPLPEGVGAHVVSMRDPVVIVRGPWELSFSTEPARAAAG